jgi:hypothetical protein
MLHQHRIEGNAIYNAATCIPFLVIIVLASLWGISVTGSDSGAVIAFPLFIVFGLLYLWIPSKIFQHWYLHIDEDGVLYNIFIVKRMYPWSEIEEVTTEKSAGFSGSYDDTLVVRTKTSTLTFFLPNYDLDTKKRATKFTEQAISQWNEYKSEL